ncbi:MAG: exopolysaccharide biosynthesis protein [Minwuia sp.]|nr:exopolysaccharide biosynthesis protein [Minwuia sp.]
MNEQDDRPMQSVVDQTIEAVDGTKVTVADLLEIFSDRGFGPILIALGLLAVSPIGAIPTVPSMLAVVIVLVSAQLVFGRKHPWVPERLRRQGFSTDRVERLRDTGHKWLRRIDWLFTSRLQWATNEVARRVAALLCVGLAFLMIPLELVPFAVYLPGTAILLFGLALTARDGLFMLLATALAVVTLVLAIDWLG